MRWLTERWRRAHVATETRHERGRAAERIARQWLEREGLVIEAANVRLPVGEVDLIAQEGTTLCFVEVRSRTSGAYGGPLASIGEEKRRHLIRAAQWYLQRRSVAPEAVRFDVVSIAWHAAGPPTVELVRGAFDAS